MSTRKNEASWSDAKNRWRLDVQRDGTRKTFTSKLPGRKGKLDAERKADLWLSKDNRNDMRFGVLWEEFLAHKKATTGPGNYRLLVSRGRLYLLPAFEHKLVSKITRLDYQTLIEGLHAERDLSKGSLVGIQAALSTLYSYADLADIPMASPRKIIIPRGAKVSPRIILQPDDLKTLFSVSTISIRGTQCQSFFVYAFRFMVLTGLRPGELLGLRTSDIFNGSLHISRAFNIYDDETPGKNINAQRSFVLTNTALAVLADQKNMLDAAGVVSPWVFPREDGSRPTYKSLCGRWIRYRDQHLSAKSSLYELRHTMVSVVSPDLPEKFLKSVVGHAFNMDTLGVYAHEVHGDSARTRDMIDAAFARVLSFPDAQNPNSPV